MRWPNVPVLICLFLGTLALRTQAAIPPWTELKLRQSAGTVVTEHALLCEKTVTNCTVNMLVDRIADMGGKLVQDFEANKSGIGFSMQECNAWINAITTEVATLKKDCLAKYGFPGWTPDCIRMEISMRLLLEDPASELGVVCRILSPEVPGTGASRLPSCDALVTATTSNHLTLTECANFNRTRCVQNFCGVYEQFYWRIHPYNLLPEPEPGKARNALYEQGYMLPGCEALADFPFDKERCHRREDVVGFCDCICEGMPQIGERNSRNCAAEIDKYLMFGRLGVAGVDLSMDCEPELCDMFGEQRNKDTCASLELPKVESCRGLVLHSIDKTCPWVTDSGENDIMECLDRHRCDVSVDGWACCEHHQGRGRCPLNKPVMCDTLCSGLTEYCCGSLPDCTPRPCSAVIDNQVQYHPITTTMTSTTPPGAVAREPESGGITIEIPKGFWVWLILAVPVLIGFVGLCIWRRIRAGGITFSEPPIKMEQANDKHGNFWRVEPKPTDMDKIRKRTVVQLTIKELPELRPLGVELLETKVIRLHGLGAMNGFQVGDVIVEVAGIPVTSFEDIWARIQVERDRVPCRFLVERGGAKSVPAGEMKAIEEAKAIAAGLRKKKASKSKIAPQPLESVVGAEVTRRPRDWASGEANPKLPQH